MGVKVEQVRPGNGKTYPRKGNTLEVHYTGKLAATGQKFNSSRDGAFKFVVGAVPTQVIRGWDEGMLLLSLNEKAKLIISADYAYSEAGSGNADLIFDVELISIDGRDGKAMREFESELNKFVSKQLKAYQTDAKLKQKYPIKAKYEEHLRRKIAKRMRYIGDAPNDDVEENAKRMAAKETDQKFGEDSIAVANSAAAKEAKEEAAGREEADRKTQEEARNAKEDAEAKAKEEADRKAKEDADRKANEEADLKAKEEAGRKAKEEAAAKEEADRKAKEEADRKVNEAKVLRAKEEADRKAKEEAAAKEEAERKAEEEADRQANEEKYLKAKNEADRKAKEQAAAKQDADRKAKEEVDRKATEEAEMKAREEADRKVKEELLAKGVADRKAKEAVAPKPTHVVIGGGDKGGIVVREGSSLKSNELSRLATGANIQELDRTADGRFKFSLVSGDGPSTGWVSLSVKGNPMLEAI